jgi:hypothetical protein
MHLRGNAINEKITKIVLGSLLYQKLCKKPSFIRISCKFIGNLKKL